LLGSEILFSAHDPTLIRLLKNTHCMTIGNADDGAGIHEELPLPPPNDILKIW
jgi:hypothetical protein